MTLPAPGGPCLVGTIELQLLDTSRPQHLMSNAVGRCLRVRMWYPADPQTAAPLKPALAWSNLRRDARTPRVVRMLLALLRSRVTARSGAPLLMQTPASAPIIYHHGFISFAEENESLMEMAASHGHLVISIQHVDQLKEYQALQRQQSAQARKTAAQLASRIMRASATERAARAREYYAASANTGRIVMERAADTAFVLERMPTLRAALPGAPLMAGDGIAVGALAAQAVHLMGFSVGGAVATAVAHSGARAISVINLDGGTQGIIDATALRVPYLMLYSAANAGINDALLPRHAQRVTLHGTRHLNFHDMAGLIPALRFTPALGGGDPCDLLQQRNEAVRQFLQKTKGVSAFADTP